MRNVFSDIFVNNFLSVAASLMLLNVSTYDLKTGRNKRNGSMAALRMFAAGRFE